jgi:hypothetical protein
MNDPFWYDNIDILYKSEKLIEFFPIAEQTIEEKLNAIMRLSIYITILLYISNEYNVKYLFIAITMGLLTIYIYKNQPEIQNIEKLEDGNETERKCTAPTLDNPFMNVTMKDYLNTDDNGNIVDRLEACDINDPEIKKMADDAFNHNLYRDVGDLWGKNNSQRQFFTMPWTTIPNKQDEFARWLYLSPATCKEDQGACLRYEDIRAKSNGGVQFNPNENPISTKKQEI